mgnify:CR=1 FL=1
MRKEPILFIAILAPLAWEREMIREQVVSGLDNARKKGRVGGRPTNLTDEVRLKIVEMKGAGVPIRKIKDECSVGTATIYKVLNEGNPIGI